MSQFMPSPTNVNQPAPQAEVFERQSVSICQRLDVIRARQVGSDVAYAMGFDPRAVARITTAISEVTRNVLDHSGACGNISFEPVERAQGHGLLIKVVDNGCGIADREAVLHTQPSSSVTRLGAGLPSAKRIMSEFEIVSNPESGTEVSMVLWLEPASPQ